MSAPPVRVAICDDSRSYAEAARSFLEADGTLEVVAITQSAEQLITELPRVRPDLVTMDLELPGIDAREAIRQIMATYPVPIVVLSAHVEHRGSSVAQAIDAGALEAIAKSQLRVDRRSGPQAIELRKRLARLAPSEAPPRAPTAHLVPETVTEHRRRSANDLPEAGTATVVGIAASAGGPPALAKVLGLLPADYTLPVLVVQHTLQGFTAGLAEWLDATVAPPVRLARDGEPAGRGVAVAPDGAHLLLDADGRLRLDTQADGSAHCPSADTLLASLAQSAGRGAVAVVLTGMGRDGAAGVAAVRDAGGVAITERSEHAVLSSMPAAAAKAGARPLELVEIGQLLAQLSTSRRR